MSKGKLCSREASAEEGPFVGAVIEARGSSKNAEREILVVSHSGMEMRGTLFLGRDCVVVEMTLLRKVTVTPGPMVKIWVTKRGNFWWCVSICARQSDQNPKDFQLQRASGCPRVTTP